MRQCNYQTVGCAQRFWQLSFLRLHLDRQRNTAVYFEIVETRVDKILESILGPEPSYATARMARLCLASADWNSPLQCCLTRQALHSFK